MRANTCLFFAKGGYRGSFALLPTYGKTVLPFLEACAMRKNGIAVAVNGEHFDFGVKFAGAGGWGKFVSPRLFIGDSRPPYPMSLNGHT